MDRKKNLILMVLGILGLVTITAGVTYAFFNYVKEGTTDNTITTGTITFLYTEVSGVGKGISINDAYPISDSQGKAQTGEGKVFDFKVTSNTPNKSSIPYEVTARKKDTSTLNEDAVKLYLTKVSGTVEDEVLLDNYSNLNQTTKVETNKYIEKTIYNGKVPSNQTNYEQNFRLRMWIDDQVDFSPVKDENGQDVYPYNDKEFTVTVNVYANAKVVTEEDIVLESNTNISNLSAGDTKLTKVEGKDYQYETSLPEGTTSTTINIETQNPYATVEIERIDSLAMDTANIKRLSTKRTLELLPGDNYFKITVISENKEIESEYKLKIRVKHGEILLSKAIFDTNKTIYENPTLTKTSQAANEKGLYKSTATNSGNPTYYYRGNVENNYVDFAGFTWRVVRINEDGTIRLIMKDGINNNTCYSFSDSNTVGYYTNSNVKAPLETWYAKNIEDRGFSQYVITGDYYCEQYRKANVDFKCSDGTHGIVNSNIGLLTYDEVIYAGGLYSPSGAYKSTYYLKNIRSWTMSALEIGAFSYVYVVSNDSSFYHNGVANGNMYLNPVINLKADTIVLGEGTSESHWVVQ